MNIVTNFNIRPTTILKQSPQQINLPVASNISNTTSLKLINNNLIKQDNSSSIINKMLSTSQKINDNRFTKDFRKKDAETQTEEIFFKM